MPTVFNNFESAINNTRTTVYTSTGMKSLLFKSYIANIGAAGAKITIEKYDGTSTYIDLVKNADVPVGTSFVLSQVVLNDGESLVMTADQNTVLSVQGNLIEIT